jgi:hypothetical protein
MPGKMVDRVGKIAQSPKKTMEQKDDLAISLLYPFEFPFFLYLKLHVSSL